MTKTKTIKIIAIMLLVLLVGVLGALAVGGSVWSVLGGFCTSALVVLASWQRAFNNVQNALRSESAVQLAHQTTSRYDSALAEELEDSKPLESTQDSTPPPKKPKLSKLFSWHAFKGGATLFVAPWRLVAYALLVVVLLALLRHNVFGVVSFLFGSLLALGALLGCLLANAQKNSQ